MRQQQQRRNKKPDNYNPRDRQEPEQSRNAETRTYTGLGSEHSAFSPEPSYSDYTEYGDYSQRSGGPENQSGSMGASGTSQNYEIEVEVKKDKVTLSGTVPHRQMKNLAEEVAEKCSGGKDVINQIRVKSLI